MADLQRNPISNNKTTIHPTYRADINGLRGIAVLSVLVFHAFPTLLPGGFIGVDIFFVISGFLISSIIGANLHHGSFRFSDFYARRIRRIFPALLLVLICCLVAGWFSLLAEEYSQLGKHVAAGAGFISNLALWAESGYFDTASSTKPLLHLWSLGIEEQFYLVWPVLLWLCWKRTKNLLPLTVLLCLFSFAINIETVGLDSAAAYYAPWGRFWELLAGALLALRAVPARACAPAQATPPAATTTARAMLLAVAGALLIAAALLLLDANALFPGWWALLPVSGTALLIGAGRDSWFHRQVLSSRLLEGIGYISYPLYLWHWPLLSFARILTGGTPSAAWRVLCLLGATVLAWLTYRLVERPYRARSFGVAQVLGPLSLMLLTGFVGWNIHAREGLPFRHEQLSAAKPANAPSAGFTSLGVSIAPEGDTDSCSELVTTPTKIKDSFCHLTAADPQLAVLGDSHSNHLLYGLKHSPVTVLNHVLVSGAGGCQPALDGGQSQNCDEQARRNIELVKKFPSIRYVVLSADASWVQTHSAETDNTLLKGYLTLASVLQGMGKKVIYVRDTPGFRQSPANCAPNPLPIRNLFRSSSENCSSLPMSATLQRDVYNHFVQALHQANGAMPLIDAYALFCDRTRCKETDDNTLLFRDSNHLTDYGSQLLAQRMALAIR